MKVSDLLAKLMDMDPETYIDISGGVLEFVSEQEGYHDGPYWRMEGGKMCFTRSDNKARFYVSSPKRHMFLYLEGTYDWGIPPSFEEVFDEIFRVDEDLKKTVWKSTYAKVREKALKGYIEYLKCVSF